MLGRACLVRGLACDNGTGEIYCSEIMFHRFHHGQRPAADGELADCICV
jgi:hypothetical protein